jgi:hypothetical protein
VRVFLIGLAVLLTLSLTTSTMRASADVDAVGPALNGVVDGTDSPEGSW